LHSGADGLLSCIQKYIIATYKHLNHKDHIISDKVPHFKFTKLIFTFHKLQVISQMKDLNPMEQSPSWEARGYAASQKIPWPLWSSKVHYCVCNSWSPDSITSLWTWQQHGPPEHWYPTSLLGVTTQKTWTLNIHSSLYV